MVDNSLKNLSQTFPGLADLKEPLAQTAAMIRVSDVAVSKKTDAINIYIICHQYIHKKELRALEKTIKKELFGHYDILINIIEKYELSSQYTPKILIERCNESLIYELDEKNRILARFFRDAVLEYPDTDTLIIKVNGSSIFNEIGRELQRFMDEVLNVRCGFNVNVLLEYKDSAAVSDSAGKRHFDDQTKEISKRLEEAGSKSRNEEAEKAASKATKGGRDQGSLKRKSSDPDVIYGYDVSADPVSISEIDEEQNDVVIKGEVLLCEARELKNGKYLFKFSLTDYTDTISVKLFLSPEMYEDLKNVIKKGLCLKLKGKAVFDTFDHELTISSVNGIRKILSFKENRTDNEPEKRIELHCHSKMSDMDGVTDIKELVKRAYAWGHKAIAVTDHGVVQAFPDANHALEDIDKKFREEYASEHPETPPDELKKLKAPFKVIYGSEIYLCDDEKKIACDPKGQSLNSKFVVFDLETTGLSPETSKIIEIGAVCIEDQKITGRYSAFVNPQMPVPLKIEQLTGINDTMLIKAKPINEILPEFLDFCDGAALVAHNAEFDYSFIKKACEDLNTDFNATVLDTVALSRYLLPRLGRFRLDNVAKHLGVTLGKHHRAVDDAECTAGIFIKLCGMLKERGINDLDALNTKAVLDADAIRHLPVNHAVVLAKNETGRVNLYRLISESHLNYFYRRPRVPKSLFKKYRDGLIIGTACASGELFQAILKGKGEREIAGIVDFYDYLEIQPVANSEYLIEDESAENITSAEDIRAINKRIVSLGREFQKPVAATGDVHFMDPEDELYRRIIMAGQGFSDADHQAPLYLKNTREMLDEFDYLDEAAAREAVIYAPERISDMCERISPIRAGKYPPVIENSDEDLRRICYEEAHRIYGETLPERVVKRLERELTSIISNGYAVMYIIAQKLVWKSNEDGYLVGSRGSVGSSFVATMAGITEVNPLSPHYLCSSCHFVDFDSDEVKAYGGRCGSDMPDRLCPVCSKPLQKLGFDIPFETFLGFKGNKEPDIDLNFSGEYQGRAHKYTEDIFGKGQTFRAGTIGTLKDKTAFGFVKNYFEEQGISKRSCEINRIVEACTGIRRTTGQHPGGIIVLPLGEDINSFTPVQHPANDMQTDIITTHFDYHSIDQNLLKLDILGHDDPTMIRMLEVITGTNAKEIPLDEPAVMSLFRSTEALGISPADIGGCRLGCLGVPEFGTEFVIQMLLDTKPSSFSDLIRISGLSHGTDVWVGNAQTLISDGNATISTAICTRDDIMIYLISKGLESELSFTIMESVRKGKGLKPEWETVMKEHGVPDWYIWSCNKIQYMFPKAHAAAYVMMAYRIAWYKIYYPLAYYAAFFSIRASGFSYDIMCRGKDRLLMFLNDYESRINELSKKEQDVLKDMKIVREMYARGFDFVPIDIYEADASRFKIKGSALMPSLASIEGLGEKAAEAVVEAAKEGAFISLDDFKKRTKVSQTIIDYMTQTEILKGLPKSNQMSLFEL